MSDSFDSTRGKALLASPHLEDPNFQYSVVYIVRHNDEEAFGLIINRPTEHSLASVLEQAAHAEIDRRGWLHFGGPVNGPLVALHDQADFADLRCGHGIYLTTDRDHLLSVLTLPDANVKVFSGFSGWGPGQLDSERSSGSWFVSNIGLEQVLGESENLWKTLLDQVGHSMWSKTGFDLGDPTKATWN